jgi:hypothetical protein
MIESLTCNVVRDAFASVAKWSGGGYVTALDLALNQVRPNFETHAYETAFRQNALDQQQFASLLASNLYMEGYSAGRLKQYAGVVDNPQLKSDLFRHAADEARHSRQFFELICLVFPKLVQGAVKDEAERNVIDLDAVSACPAGYPAPPAEEVLNSLILMNLFEIKALILGNMIKPFAVAHAPRSNADQAEAIVTNIARDECHHIAYTARHIDRFIGQQGPVAIAETMAGFIEMMNGSDDFYI